MKGFRAFTIIEMLVYIGLVSLLMTGSLVSAYALTQSSARNATEAHLIHESQFVLRTIRDAVQRGDIAYPLSRESGDSLDVHTTDSGPVSFHLDRSRLVASDGPSALPLSPYDVSGLSFERSGARKSPIDPERITVRITFSAPVPGGILERTFIDTIYVDAP